MSLPNIFNWIKKTPIVESPFFESWEGEGINPPPPKSELRIINNGSARQINTTGDLRKTNTI